MCCSRFASSVFFLCLCSPLGLLAQASQPSPSQELGKGLGDLMLLPNRVVLEGRTRAAEVMLRNVGTAKATYRISLKEMAMGPEGVVEDRTKVPGELTAADLIRYSPHQVDLAPGEAQVVRIQVRKPENLAAGEYRSHMVFRAVPSVEAPESTDPEKDKKQLTIMLKAIYGISIPVIVRHGETSASVSLANLRFQEPPQEGLLSAITLDLQRQGNRSVMGDFEAIAESGGSLKKGTMIGYAKGLAIYDTLPSRKILVALQVENFATLRGARLKIRFTPKDIKLDPIEAFVDIP